MEWIKFDTGLKNGRFRGMSVNCYSNGWLDGITESVVANAETICIRTV